MKNCIDLNLGEAVHKSIISFISQLLDFNLLNDKDFYFLSCDTLKGEAVVK